MAKIIKRVGIVFFALVISCLLIVGVTLSSNVASESFELDSNANKNIQNSADYSVTLTSSNQASKWKEAIQYSLDNGGVNVNVTLGANWTATEGGEFTTSFGTGVGFNKGSIFIPQGSTITLDLNGYSLDRHLENRSAGPVIHINGIFNLYDNKYTTIKASELNSVDKIKASNIGKVTGGSAVYPSYTNTYSGGVYMDESGKFNMYGGIIYNNSGKYGGGISVQPSATQFNMYDGLIAFNNAIDGGAVAAHSDTNLYGGFMRNNIANAFGGAICYGGYDGRAANLVINGCIITNNESQGVGNVFDGGSGGGVFHHSDNGGNLYLGAGTQIYGNTSNGQASNLGLRQDIKIIISESLLKDGKSAYVGINLRDGYPGVFTEGYSEHNTLAPNRFFFSDDSGFVVSSKSNEIELVSGTKPSSLITWCISTGVNTYNYQSSNVILPYNDKGYSVSISGLSFHDSNGTSNTMFWKKNPGNYSFYVDGNYLNPTFTLTILDGKINAPVANTQTYVYNGSAQEYLPSNFDTNTMYITNNIAINAGKYNAFVTPNLYNTWSDGSKNPIIFEYVIEPKKLQIPTAVENLFLYDGNEHILNKYDNFDTNTMKIENNQATDIGKYKAKISLKDTKNYTWADGSTTPKEIAYEIIHSGIVAKETSGYEYIYFDNNYRKSYGSAYTHKLNDTNLNNKKFILGSIKANTTINTFIASLKNDSNLLKVYNTKGKLLFDGLISDGVISQSAKNILVGTGFKVEFYQNNTETSAYDTIYLSVLGDVNGDGIINASDVAYLRQVANDSTLLENMPLERQLACMINNKGGITEVDSEILRNYIGKEIDLEKFMESETANTSNTYTYLTLDRDNMLRKVSESKTNVIGNIAVNTSVEMLKTKLAEIGINISAITIYNRKGEAVSDNSAIVGTGWRIEIGGEVTYLSVLGDLTGDGRITAADISYLRALVVNDTTNVQDCILLSAILLNKGGITTADSEVLKQAIKGSILLSEYNN